VAAAVVTGAAALVGAAGALDEAGTDDFWAAGAVTDDEHPAATPTAATMATTHRKLFMLMAFPIVVMRRSDRWRSARTA
jgi:hypothetical protein